MVGIWSILSAISPIIAPVLSLLLILIGRIIWNHEQRIRDLETGGTRRSRTLYGDEHDERSTGLSHDLEEIDNRLEGVEETLGYIERHLSDINGYDRQYQEEKSRFDD